MNQTIIKRVRCIIFDANYSAHFWVEAVMTIAYLINISPSTAIEMKTPEEKWSGYPWTLCKCSRELDVCNDMYKTLSSLLNKSNQ